MTITGVVELTLQVRDLRSLEAFYTDVFGLRVLERADDRVWLAAGERSRLGLWLPGEKEFGDEGGAHVHYAFGVQPGTLDAIVGRLHERGIEVEGPVGTRAATARSTSPTPRGTSSRRGTSSTAARARRRGRTPSRRKTD